MWGILLPLAQTQDERVQRSLASPPKEEEEEEECCLFDQNGSGGYIKTHTSR